MSLNATTLGLTTQASTSQYYSESLITYQQTSGLTSATAVFTTGSVFSLSAGTTTTSSSTETTSTPQTTSRPTTAPTTTSSSTSSSSSTPSSTTSSTSSTVSPSSSVLPSSTIQPPIPPSSSQLGTQTTITSAFTTYVNGSPLLTQTSFPTTIPQLSNSSSSGRTAIIAGSAAGGTALLILLLSLAFCARRKQFQKLDFLHTISLRRKRARSRATLLDGEDDLALARLPQRYTDYDTPWDNRASIAARAGPGRPSDTREEWWPPPTATEATRLMDPLANKDDVDLSRIVDDVMGPPSSAAHFSGRSVSSVYRDSVAESEGAVHSRTVSDASNMALLGGGVGSTVPVRSSPLTQPGTKPDPGSAENQDVS